MPLAKEKQQNMDIEREWKARLELKFSNRDGHSYLSHRKHIGPLVVQRAFYPEGDVCHSYIIHPPGGVVGGDKLAIDVKLEEHAHALITTPSAGKFYRSETLKGLQSQKLTVDKGATLEWFPQENIFFNGCNSELTSEITLEDDAKFCGWEINCLGRPASHALFEQGKIIQGIKLYRHGQPIFLERNAINGAGDLLFSRAGFNGQTVFGTMLATGMDKQCCEELQQVWHDKSEKNISITLINDVLVCRYLGQSAEQAKKLFVEIWKTVRKKQNQLAICAPRIWAT